MILTLLSKFLQILIGFSSGLAVGGGFVAFIVVLGIIPRLVQLSRTEHLLKVYSACIILGLLFGTYVSFSNITWDFSFLMLILWGAFHGIFNGMLAAALTEVLNVFPVLFRRIHMEQYMLALLMAIVFGKVGGSLFQWTIFVR